MKIIKGQPDWLPYDRRTANHNLCVSVGKHCIPCSDLGPTVEDGVSGSTPVHENDASSNDSNCCELELFDKFTPVLCQAMGQKMSK